jgi:hypothetical protein
MRTLITPVIYCIVLLFMQYTFIFLGRHHSASSILLLPFPYTDIKKADFLISVGVCCEQGRRNILNVSHEFVYHQL